MTKNRALFQSSRVCVVLGLWTVLAVAVSGCGDDVTPGPSPEGVTSSSPAAPVPSSATPGSTNAAAASGPNSQTKWIGDIPYDVFYDQPLVVASENTALAPTAVLSTVPDTTPAEGAPEGTAPAAGASTTAPGRGPDWKQLASADVLNEEVKRLRNSLTTNLNTLATYNRNVEAIVNDGAMLAALAAVIEVHPDRISWTDNAKYVRDLGYEISTKADGSGRGPFEATKLPFEQTLAILNGGPPPDREAADKVPFADVADRGELMKHTKKSFDYLKTEINTAARFQELQDEVTREAAVLASLGGMISTESYDSTDEELYRQFVTDFIQANVDITAAAAADDFTKFEDARGRVQNACNACHGEYAFGDEGF